jgi:dUTP pyrophosphatase
MEIKIKKLDPNAVIPKYAKNGDAGMDLFAISDFESNEYGTAMIRTGLSIEIPDGYVGLVFPRSSVYKSTGRLANSVGVIDSGYRGEIMVNFDISVPSLMLAMDVVPKDLFKSTVYKKGDRVAQLIVVPYPKVTFKEVKDLSETERGDGGFGSTDFDLAEIKKSLYKEKPKAIQTGGDIEFKYYKTLLLNGSLAYFKVPQEESLDFTQVMESQLLIRWITNKL